jgi:hypothetical protein
MLGRTTDRNRVVWSVVALLDGKRISVPLGLLDAHNNARPLPKA